MSGTDPTKHLLTTPESNRNLQTKRQESNLFKRDNKLQVKQVRFYFDPISKSFNHNWFKEDEETEILKQTDVHRLMEELNGVACYSHFHLQYFLGGVVGLMLMFAGLVLGTSTVSKWYLLISLAGFAVLAVCTYFSSKRTAKARKARKSQLLDILNKHEADTFRKKGLGLKMGPGLSYIIIEIRQTTIFDDPDQQPIEGHNNNQPNSDISGSEPATGQKIGEPGNGQHIGQPIKNDEVQNSESQSKDKEQPHPSAVQEPLADIESQRKVQIPKPAKQGPKVLDDSFDLQ